MRYRRRSNWHRFPEIDGAFCMTDPVSFDHASPRLGLPLLYTGQAQKEFFVNEALATIDSLLHGAIEAVANTPPATPAEGATWLIGSDPTGAWVGQEGALASRQNGNWLFAKPCDGMRLLDRSTGQDLRYSGGWKRATPPAAASGGTVIDVEARVAIVQLIAALRVAGVFPAT